MEAFLLALNATLLAAFLWRLTRLGSTSIPGYLALLPLACLVISIIGASIAVSAWRSIFQLDVDRMISSAILESAKIPHSAPDEDATPIGSNLPRTIQPSSHFVHLNPGDTSVKNMVGAGAEIETERVPADENSPDSVADEEAKTTNSNRRPAQIFNGPRHGNRVAFVYDDGPHPVQTPLLLDLLKENRAKASFAVLARNVKRHPEITRRIAEEGHQLIVHGETHESFVSLNSTEKLDGEIVRSMEILRKVTGVTPDFVRPPYGDITKNLAKDIHEKWGLRTVMWDVDPQDYHIKNADKIFEHLSLKTRPGSINVLHDHVAETLEATLLFIQAHQHFELVTVSELLAQPEPLLKETAPALNASAPPARKLPFQIVTDQSHLSMSKEKP